MEATNAPGEHARQERSRGRRVLLWASVALVLVVALLWLLWGFRWPPTAEVASEPPEVSRVEPGSQGGTRSAPARTADAATSRRRA